MEGLKQSSEKLSYRLPTSSIPLSYEIIIRSNIHSVDFEFNGEVNIHVKIVEATDTITLHQRDMEIDGISLVEISRKDETMIVTDLTYQLIPSHDFLRIFLPRIFHVSDELILCIRYHGELLSDASGFYRGCYIDENEQYIWYAATKFQINNARHAIPCYDEPGIRAAMRLTVIHGRNYSALSNMDVEEIVEFIDFSVTKFKQTPPMQAYLLAFVISDFKCIHARNSRIPQRIFAKASSIAKGEVDFAAEIVGPLLHALEGHFGLNYPLPKLDHVALSHFINGAMENFGIIHYIERAILLNPLDNDEAKKMTIIRIVTHELVHQFFGNTVSPKWWNFTWLSEGLATLYEVFIADIAFPQYNFMRRFFTTNMPLSFREDINGVSWALNHYSEEPSELKNYFNKIGFEKASCVLRMFQEAITPMTFSKGLNYYLNHSFMKEVTPHDLHNGLQRAFNQDFPLKSFNISKAMSTWENQAGYPIVSVRTYGTNVIVSQSCEGSTFSIPLTLATKSNPKFTSKMPRFWLNGTSMAITYESIDFNENDWIILNIQQVGYYRTDYDTKLWRAIINQLIKNSAIIHAINRAVLQDEIYLAWREFKRVTAYECLNILSYLGRENESMTWNCAQALMRIFYDRLFGTCIYKKFLEFLQKITNPHVNKHGFETKETDSSTIKSLRTLVKAWNCHVLGGDCLEHERVKLKRFLSMEKTTEINFCAAIRNVDEETFNSLANAVAMSSEFVNRENFLNSLGCSLNRKNLKKFLEISINFDNVLTENERLCVIKSTMGRSVVGFEITIDFIIDNNEQICKRLSTSSIYDVLSCMTSYINTQLNVDRMEGVIVKMLQNNCLNEEDAATLRALYLENIKWHIDNYDPVERWLMENLKFSECEKTQYMDCLQRSKYGFGWKPKRKKRKYADG